MTLELQATSEEVMRAVEALNEFGRARQVPEKALFGLALALEECGSNIVNHALNRDPHQKFQVSFEYTRTALRVELRDPGPEFDPTRAAQVEAGGDHDERAPGGWGIQLVRRYMDDIRYRREKNHNVLCLTKNLSPGDDSK